MRRNTRTLLPSAALAVLPFALQAGGPTVLRNTNEYAKALSPVAPHELRVLSLNQFTITREGNTVAIVSGSKGAADDSDGFPHTVEFLRPDQPLQGVGARFELAGVASFGPGFSPAGTARNQEPPLVYHGPDGKKLTAAALQALGFKPWEFRRSAIGSSSGVDDAFPNLHVALGSCREPPGGFSMVGLFETQTKRSLASGSSSSQISTNQLGHVYLHPRLWHAARMQLVLDVELDGKSVTEAEVAPGATVTVPGGKVLWLGAWDGSFKSWSSQSGGFSNVRLGLSQHANEKNAVVVYVTEPPKLAVHVQWQDGSGRLLEENAGGGNDIRFAGLRGSAADLKRARLTVFTNHHRVVLPLPPIPNLPPENQRPDNLFAIRIPQLKLRSESELRDFIGETTEMSFVYPPGGDVMPVRLFPLVLSNATPAQLLDTYSRYLTNHTTVVVDEHKREIRVEPTPFEKAKRWVSTWLPDW